VSVYVLQLLKRLTTFKPSDGGADKSNVEETNVIIYFYLHVCK